MTAPLLEASRTTPADWAPSWGPAPRWATPRSPDRPTYGPAAAKIAKRLGTPLFPWQRYVVDVALEVDPATGHLAYDEVIVLVQRRAGKTVLIAPVTVWRCGRPKIRQQAWLTAQKRDNAVDRWRDAADSIEDALGPAVKKKIGNMAEELRWPATRSIFVPFAPAEDTMHGADPDLAFVDELWSFTAAQQAVIEGGYEPTFSVKPGSQVWKLSAAGTARSEWLKADRMRGRAAVQSGGRSRIAFFEWCVPERVDGVPVGELDDGRLIEVVLANHPRRDHGLRADFLTAQLAKNRPRFLRAYGGLDEDESTDDALLPLDVVQGSFTVDRIPGLVRVAFGVEVDPDRREASISACWRDAGGRALTQLLDQRPGSSWVPGRVLELVADNAGGNPVGVVAVNQAGPARNVADELDRSGVPLLRVSQTDVAAAAAQLYDQLTADEPLVTHDNDDRLLGALKAAGWRRLPAGGRAWASNTGEPITPLNAHTLAVWGFDHMPEPEPDLPPFKIY